MKLAPDVDDELAEWLDQSGATFHVHRIGPRGSHWFLATVILDKRVSSASASRPLEALALARAKFDARVEGQRPA